MNGNPLRNLPSVGALLEHPDSAALIEHYGRPLTVEALRETLDTARTAILSGTAADLAAPALLATAAKRLQQGAQSSLRPVINATGVIIHTNLGRAPLSESAVAAMQAVAGSYSTLEFDLEGGGRGSRNVHPQAILTELTGAEAALVVNNAASALVLALAATSRGHQVIVSRGQAVEIGGGFRIPEIMAQSGATLVEVGTTNRTRASDYANAATEQTAALLRVHSSNFKQVGFTESASIEEMAAVAQAHGVLLIDDVGSGALLDTGQFGLAPEPTVQASIDAGADLVLFSGDKLLGGPQAGVIVGTAEAVERLRKHPFARALRADKLAMAGLVATLEHYRRGEALEKVPVWWMMGRTADDLREIAAQWAAALPNAEVIAGESTVGGGSVPGSALATHLLALTVDDADGLARRLREANPPVITRIAEGRVLLDPRTVFPAQEQTLLATLKRAVD